MVRTTLIKTPAPRLLARPESIDQRQQAAMDKPQCAADKSIGVYTDSMSAGTLEKRQHLASLFTSQTGLQPHVLHNHTPLRWSVLRW